MEHGVYQSDLGKQHFVRVHRGNLPTYGRKWMERILPELPGTIDDLLLQGRRICLVLRLFGEPHVPWDRHWFLEDWAGLLGRNQWHRLQFDGQHGPSQPERRSNLRQPDSLDG